MKFLVTWYHAPEHTKEASARAREFKQKGKWKTLYPLSSPGWCVMVGRNKSFCVVECDDIVELYKDIRGFSDVMTYDIIPIEEMQALRKVP